MKSGFLSVARKDVEAARLRCPKSRKFCRELWAQDPLEVSSLDAGLTMAMPHCAFVTSSLRSYISVAITAVILSGCGNFLGKIGEQMSEQPEKERAQARAVK